MRGYCFRRNSNRAIAVSVNVSRRNIANASTVSVIRWYARANATGVFARRSNVYQPLSSSSTVMMVASGSQVVFLDTDMASPEATADHPLARFAECIKDEP